MGSYNRASEHGLIDHLFISEALRERRQEEDTAEERDRERKREGEKDAVLCLYREGIWRGLFCPKRMFAVYLLITITMHTTDL